jgi:4'-phosphopantetheinyl transferase
VIPPARVPPSGTARPEGPGLARNTVPSGGTVDVWWFDTREVTVSPAGLADLDRGERDRADAFVFPADRHRYQVAHVMLRRVLARYTGTAPGALVLGRAPCPRCGAAAGKPVLLPRPGPPPAAGPVPSFSLTHSGDMVAIAVAGRPVGVDAERDAAGCVCSLAETLHPADAARLDGLAGPDRHHAIIACWVRAEAMLKCTGQGIGHGLGGFPVGPARAAAFGADLSVNGCTVRPLAAPPGYQAAVAVAGPGPLALRRAAGRPGRPR